MSIRLTGPPVAVPRWSAVVPAIALELESVVTGEPIVDGEAGVASDRAAPAGSAWTSAVDNGICPKRGLLTLHAAMTCGATCGKSLVTPSG
jgi:hypothetical protein